MCLKKIQPKLILYCKFPRNFGGYLKQHSCETSHLLKKSQGKNLEKNLDPEVAESTSPYILFYKNKWVFSLLLGFLQLTTENWRVEDFCVSAVEAN